MNPATEGTVEPVAPTHAPAVVEAARYALLRRLAPSIRHHLVVHLQPISMVHELLDRRLRAAEPNLLAVQESANKIHGFARAALASTLNMVGWLAPDAAAVSRVDTCVAECASLLGSSLSFRGYALHNEVAGVEGEVSQPALRSVLTATLLFLSDEQPAPADLRITAKAGPDGVRLSVTSTAATHGDDTASATSPVYRALTWADLQALAGDDGVHVERADASAVHLLLPWATPR